MSKYKFWVNTDSYVCAKCSKKNWESGTRNDYMLAINGIERKLNSIREIRWQLELFRGNTFLSSEYSEKNQKENNGLSDRYIKFLKKNTIKYYDRLCDMEREHPLSGYGFMQGYFPIDDFLEVLKKHGRVKIPFEWLYDIRQFDKHMRGCYIEIIKQ